MKLFKLIILLPLLLGNFFYSVSQDTVSLESKPDSLFKIDTVNANISDSICDFEEQDTTVFPIIQTFLGNWERNYYGENAPDTLGVVWKLFLGTGETVISRKAGKKKWAGSGWTGQPLLVSEKGKLFLIQGAYDHHLKKISADSGKVVWQYKFDDVIKGTGTIWVNDSAKNADSSLIILQGSRLGTGHFLDAKHVPSYRAISYHSGKELWRMDQELTRSYSRDVDGSALILNDTAYLGFENSIFKAFDPNPANADSLNGMIQPKIHLKRWLHRSSDVKIHRGNLVTESSPSLLGNRIYIASGSGHIWGYNLKTKEIDWDFFIGSDIDGSAIVTKDSNILVSVEKQYIKGKGGAFKLDPSKDPKDAAVWYFPVNDKNFAGWEGGIIGSIGINDNYVDSTQSKLAAFVGIDNYLYVVNHQLIDTSKTVLGPDSLTKYSTPVLVFKEKIGPSISTPVFVDDKLIVAGYWGIRIYQYNKQNKFTLLDKRSGGFESTPIVWNNKIYIGSRDGYLYCFGIKD